MGLDSRNSGGIPMTCVEMTSTADLLHSLPGSQLDLRFFVRFWEWEHSVRENLPRVLAERDIAVAFQPIFRLDDGRAIPCGFEALARFPIAPRIPVGLWFRTARDVGVGYELERLAASTAAGACSELSADRFLNINVSLTNVSDVVNDIAPRLDAPLVVDLPCTALRDEACHATFDQLRASGVEVSLDDIPLDQLYSLRPVIGAVQPRYLKVDVLSGLFDNPMGRFNLAEGAAWCRDAGIALVVERIESPEDLEMLHDLGVEMAQGYSLARPA